MAFCRAAESLKTSLAVVRIAVILKLGRKHSKIDHDCQDSFMVVDGDTPQARDTSSDARNSRPVPAARR